MLSGPLQFIPQGGRGTSAALVQRQSHPFPLFRNQCPVSARAFPDPWVPWLRCWSSNHAWSRRSPNAGWHLPTYLFRYSDVRLPSFAPRHSWLEGWLCGVGGISIRFTALLSSFPVGHTQWGDDSDRCVRGMYNKNNNNCLEIPHAGVT